MNRRGLLAALFAAPAAPLLAKIAPPVPETSIKIVSGRIDGDRIVAGTIMIPRFVLGDGFVETFDAQGVKRVRLGTW